jgi:hypothetical protein
MRGRAVIEVIVTIVIVAILKLVGRTIKGRGWDVQIQDVICRLLTV